MIYHGSDQDYDLEREDMEEAWSGKWERQSQTSAVGENQHVEQKYFQILLCELKIYLDQSRGDCWRTHRDYFGEFYFVYVELPVFFIMN